MKKLLAAALLLTLFAGPAFASNTKPRTYHPHYNYKYKAPKYHKPHAQHHHQLKQHHAK
jgi:hypothetical protein